MTEYLEKATALDYLIKRAEEAQADFDENGGESGIYAECLEDVIQDIQSMPAVEVEVIHKPTESEFKRMAVQKGYEPVVHCSECRYHHDCETHFCDRLGMDCPDDSDFFCKYGARIDGGEDDV